ncbi:hypothetical protein D9M69_377830 [compost metagenome]
MLCGCRVGGCDCRFVDLFLVIDQHELRLGSEKPFQRVSQCLGWADSSVCQLVEHFLGVAKFDVLLDESSQPL